MSQRYPTDLTETAWTVFTPLIPGSSLRVPQDDTVECQCWPHSSRRLPRISAVIERDNMLPFLYCQHGWNALGCPGGSTKHPVCIQDGTPLTVLRYSNLMSTAYLEQFSTFAVDNLYKSVGKSNKIEGPRQNA